jgi:hypothetical protein
MEAHTTTTPSTNTTRINVTQGGEGRIATAAAASSLAAHPTPPHKKNSERHSRTVQKKNDHGIQ